jgi:predicted CopG family antitoxin
MKKLTISVSDEVYAGLYAKIGTRNISRFIDHLARAHVLDNALEDGYKAMAADASREDEAFFWLENILADNDETR